MANYGAREKIDKLTKLLEQSNCTEREQIMEIVDSIINGLIDANGNYKDEIYTLYNNIFFRKQPDKQLIFEAYRLEINNPDSRIILFKFENSNKAEFILEILESIAASKEGQNYVVPVGYEYIAVIYEVNSEHDIREFAGAAAESILDELGIKTDVGIGGCYSNVLDAGRSYKEAEIALEAGKTLLNDSVVYEYEKLGLARLVYEMTGEQCGKFISEIFTSETIKELENKEMLESINVFFKCNLNISVAARELYVHRNTLVYRIDKFNKASGYDLSNFEDATVIKLALMIRRKLLYD